ncbi:unnamed protein product [Pseudo-nitzschia multistriata]|uniref:Proteasome activator PA28 C-terminal domain-containing protein n=1 Tax=Pseudo-nitzschia multistriata TaxID=183589 RepID=A0A448Z5P1_9STRA|nr:unnamed protein product [Pseudo-nitzschia multistriata]
MELLDSGMASVEEMQNLYSQLFPLDKLSEASNAFVGSATTASNEVVARAVATTLDQISAQNTLLAKLDLFITLHIPKIEDGGNFGVGVQLDLVKKLSEMKEAANKSIETLLAYDNARADALGKLNLPSSTTSSTKSSSATTTDGKKEEKSSESTEEKQTSSASSGPVYESRVASVVAVDTLYYSKARVIFSQTIITFVAVMDFIEKNKDKLVEPKGKSGGSNFSMY